MGNPVLGIETYVLLKKETVPGTRESLTTGAQHLDLISESLDSIPVLSGLPVMAGDRQKRATLDFVSHNNTGGSFIFRPRSAQLDTLLKWILGAGGGLAPYTPIVNDAVDLEAFTLEVTKGGQDQLALVGTKVNTAKFSSTFIEPLTIELNVLSLTGVRNSGSFTTFAPTQMDAEKPFLHGGLIMSGTEVWLDDGLAAGNVEVRSIEFTINNNLLEDGYCNSMNRRLISPGLFTLEGALEIPYNATTKGFWNAMIAAAKVKFTATWTDGDANILAASFVVKLDGELPKVSSSELQWLNLSFHGVADTTDPVCISMISTE